MPRRYIFWQPILSMHQMPFLEAVHDAIDAEVVCVHAEEVPADRLSQGWLTPSAVGVRVMRPSDPQAARLLSAGGGDAFHLFSGIHCHPYVSTIFRRAIRLGLPTAVISEPHDGHGIRGAARRMRSRVDAMRYASRLRLILAMGSLGVEWYRSAGFRPETIFPFAYVASPQPLPPARSAAGDGSYTIAFVGQLIPRKGIDLLLTALSIVRELPWKLEVVGTGPLEPVLRETARVAGTADRLTWHGSLPNQAVGPLLGSCDLLVLPSRFDGWGVVVNEALAAGTPVVCSDACGAGDLLAAPQFGRVFRAGNVASLADAIRHQVMGGRPGEATRAFLRERARRFSPVSVARYFVDVMRTVCEHEAPPCPPWRHVA